MRFHPDIAPFQPFVFSDWVKVLRDRLFRGRKVPFVFLFTPPITNVHASPAPLWCFISGLGVPIFAIPSQTSAVYDPFIYRFGPFDLNFT